MADKPDIAIIGGGRVGTALGVLAAKAGWRVAAVACRTFDHARASAARIGPGVLALPAADAARRGGLVLLTVPDDATGPVCDELAAAGALSRGAVVAHCCGALTADVLSAAKTKCHCAIGSMHPLQTFPTVESAVARLPGAWCFVEGDEAAASVLEQLAGAIGGRAVRMDPAARTLYHAAAVMACNHAVALLDASLALAEAAGIDRATAASAFEPLVRATVDNVASMGPAVALTGPVARGDVATIRRHLEALRACPAELAGFYRAAALWTVDLARRKGTIDPATAKSLRALLTEGPAKE